jgi:hypothetical protein
LDWFSARSSNSAIVRRKASSWRAAVRHPPGVRRIGRF